MSRLDLRQVENVVDESQQIVARRLYRLSVAHLFLAQATLGIVGKELREDQQRVQRRPELVRHVGQEIGFISARLFELLSPDPHDLVGAFKIVSLAFEQLRLFLELRVRLLKFSLLEFEPGLRFLQRAALLFELFVRDPQLLALRLEFLGLALSFFEEVLKLDPIVGGSDGNTNCVRHLLEKRKSVSIERMDEAKLHDGVYRSVHFRG